MTKVKIAIIGGGGYTAGELIRILRQHPSARINQVVSGSQAGKKVADVHQDLFGDLDLTFEAEANSSSDVYFLCMGHGRSGDFINNNSWLESKVVIDLSNEFRLADNSQSFIYGLPEVHRDRIAESKKIANPGCFATAIQLALVPLAYSNLLTDDVHVHAITGSTGAGQNPSPSTHFAWRNNNISIYKAFSHQHLAEINQTLKLIQPFFDKQLYFVPMRGDFARGIFASVHTRYGGSLEQALNLYQSYYNTHPFVHVTTDDVHLKQVVNTNKCIIQLRRHEDLLHITSIIDNLTKGASGQAVQNMNLCLGISESTGLELKANYY